MQSPKIEKLLYSRKEAAAMLGISPCSLWRMIQRGEIKPQNIGSRVMFNRWELLRVSGQQAAQ